MNAGIRKRILLVEDDIITALAEKKKLEKYGYTVYTVSSGKDAVEAFHKGMNIDLVLMDIDLGQGMDGTETAQIILREQEIPVVFLSSHVDQEIVEKTEKITSYGYVVKNSGITVLDASIKMAFKLFEANREVREKESLLLSVAENYPNSYVSIIDRDFTIGFISGHEFKNIAIDPQQLIGVPLDEIFTEELPLIMENYRKTFRGEECSFELLFMGQHQFYRTVPLYSSDGSIRQILSVVENITEQKEAEYKLQKSEETFRQVYENMTVGVAQVSLDFIIEGANEAYCRMLGYREEELIGKHLRDITAPEILQENLSKQSQLGSGEIDHYRLEKQFIHKTGKRVCGILDANLVRDSEGKPSYFLGTVLDTTAQIATEKALVRNRNQLESILSNLQGTSYRCLDDNDWTMLYMSPHVEKMTGYPPGDFFENRIHSYESIILREDADHVTQGVRSAIESEEPWEIEYRIRHRDGSIRWVFELGKAKVSPDGIVEYLDGFIIDITDRKKVEEKIISLLAEKEILLKEIHHRIKNNMTSVENLLSLQADSVTNQEAVSAIQNAIGRVNSVRILYDKLLKTEDYSDTSIRQYLNDLVKDILAIFYNDNITVQSDIEDFLLDSKRLFPLGIIVNELLTNTLKHAFDGMTGGTIRISLHKKENTVTLSMTDDGRGLPPDFDVDSSGGFGLMLVKILSQQLRGSFSIESAGGTRSILEFEY